MTIDERFECDLAAAIRDGAPEAAPLELRRRVEAALADPRPIISTRLPMPAIAAAAGVLVLVGAAIIGPRPIDKPGQRPGTTSLGTAVASPGDTFAPLATAPMATPIAEPIKGVPGSAQRGQLLTRNDGWVVTAGGLLFVTRSAGAAWREITPPLTPVEGRGGANPADFLDASHGLVFEQGEPHESPLVIWRTADAGVTWSRSELHGVPIGDIAFELLTPSTAWLATHLRDQALQQELRWTFDGGATWSPPIELTSLLNGASVHDLTFINEHVGFMGGDGQLRRTADGGVTWESIAFLGDDLPARYGLPELVDGSRAVLRVSILGDEEGIAERRIYVSDNAATVEGGGEWTLAVSDDLVRQWAIVDANTWIATDGLQVWTTTDGGTTFDVQPSTGLPLTLWDASMHFVDPLHGWATAVEGTACPPSSFPLPCVGTRGMFATSDGGRTWTRL